MTSILIPCAIIVIGNLLSGPPGTDSWERVTALFGWAWALFMSAWLVFFVFQISPDLEDALLQIWLFSMIQALTRDYEKILQPFRKFLRNKKK